MNFCVFHAVWIGVGILCLAMAGCAGEGYNLDEYGSPVGTVIGSMPTAFPPTFANVQREVFDRRCLDCHSGASAAVGLRLDAYNSYKMRGRRSTQVPEYYLIDPGNPGSSYLIHKMEGASHVVGAQMPMYQPPLPQATINSVRAWIAGGAH